MNQDSSLPLTAAFCVEDLCTEFEEQHRAGQSPRIEDFFVQIEDSARRHLLRELLRVEVELRRRAGQTPQADDYRPRFPDHADLVEEVLDETINKSAADQSSERSVPEKERHSDHDSILCQSRGSPSSPAGCGRADRPLSDRTQIGQRRIRPGTAGPRRGTPAPRGDQNPPARQGFRVRKRSRST
jgi:hypothetical protein